MNTERREVSKSIDNMSCDEKREELAKILARAYLRLVSQQPSTNLSDAMGNRNTDFSATEKYPGRTVHREDNTTVTTIPVKFYRRNGRRMVRANSEEGSQSYTAERNVNMTLVAAIATAYEWQDELESGKFKTIDELAKSKKVCRSYAGRMMQLTSLCPEVVEAILNGDERDGLSIRKLRQGISVFWSEQREFLRDE